MILNILYFLGYSVLMIRIAVKNTVSYFNDTKPSHEIECDGCPYGPYGLLSLSTTCAPPHYPGVH